MSYENEITKDNTEINYFIHLGFKLFDSHSGDDPLSGWTAEGDLYWKFWSGNDTAPSQMRIKNAITGVTRPDIYKQAASLDDLINGRLGASGYESHAIYLDRANNRLWASLPAFDPVTDFFYYERVQFLSTRHLAWHMFPDQGNYPMVQYYGLLQDQPVIQASVSEGIFGFFPSYEGSLTFNNENKLFDQNFIYASITNCSIDIYRCVGEIRPENTQLAFRGFTRASSFDDDSVTVSYVDASILLDSQINNGRWGDGFVSEVMEPNLAGKVRRVFLGGRVNRLAAADVNYTDSASNNFNRSWSFGRIFSSGQNVDYTTKNASVGSNTTARTYLDSVVGIAVGEIFSINSSSTTHLQVTSLGADYINHSTIGGALGTNDYIRKHKIQDLNILDTSTSVLTAVPVAYVDSLNPTSDDLRVVFKSTLEAGLSLVTPLHPKTHAVVGDIQTGTGAKDFVSLTDPLGTPDALTGYNQNAVQMIYELLYSAGFFNYGSWYDVDSFSEAASEADINIDACTPLISGSTDEQTYREVLAQICLSAQLKVFLKDGKWFCSRLTLLGSADHVIDDTNFMEGYSYKLRTDDVVQNLVLSYDPGEMNFRNEITGESAQTVSGISYLVDIQAGGTRSKTYFAYCSDPAVATVIAERLASVFSRSLGYLTTTFDLSKITIKLGETIRFDTESLPQLPFNSSVKFSVVSIRENLDTIEVEMFDQQGIEANYGVWT